MAYTYDITTNRGKVRAQLGDNTATTGATSGFVFEDDEIDEFISMGSTVDGATIVGLRVLVANRALRTKHFSLRGTTLDDRHQVKELRNLIAMYGGEMPTVSVLFPARLPMDSGFVEPVVT